MSTQTNPYIVDEMVDAKDEAVRALRHLIDEATKLLHAVDRPILVTPPVPVLPSDVTFAAARTFVGHATYSNSMAGDLNQIYAALSRLVLLTQLVAREVPMTTPVA